MLDGIAAQLSLAVCNARLYENVRRMHLGNVRALSAALTAKDNYTIGHTARVACYAVLLASELGWSHTAIEELEEVAYLHDIGKIAVSDRVLLKAGPLTSEEWELMRQHPAVSAEIIEPLLEPRLVGGVRHHHERYDGTGYPDGLAGAQIPESARLLCVVDSYDAMSSRRVYKKALSYTECLAELERCKGTQFDPALVDAFVRVLARMEIDRRFATQVASEAAACVDPAKHALLRKPADETRPEYAEICAALRAVRAAHPKVETVLTEVLVDERRCMVVVDSTEDPAIRSPIGELQLADDEELEMFCGRTCDANVVYVDAWGAWVCGIAPLRDENGGIVAIVSADIAATDSADLPRTPSQVSETFAGLVHSAAERLTRPEVDAMSDTLTGLYNHRHIQQRLTEEVDYAVEEGTELSLLFCDIDRFKGLNDDLGHAAGDDVLRQVATIVSRSIRRGDLAARFGGNAFAVMLLGAGSEQALEIAERIRSSIDEARVHPADGRLTVSVGVATLPGDARTKDELLEKADRALRLAKRRGRNRCQRFAPGEPSVDASGTRGRATRPAPDS